MKVLWPYLFSHAGMYIPKRVDTKLATFWPLMALGLWMQDNPGANWKEDPDLTVRIQIVSWQGPDGIKKTGCKNKVKVHLHKSIRRAVHFARKKYPELQDVLQPGLPPHLVAKLDGEEIDIDQTFGALGWSPWHGVMQIDVVDNGPDAE